MSSLTICGTCGELPAVPGWRVCGRCADVANRAAESEVRRLASRYEEIVARMRLIGCASFIPQTDHERRLHKAARAKLVATMDDRR